jgi:hypothetical protein
MLQGITQSTDARVGSLIIVYRRIERARTLDRDTEDQYRAAVVNRWFPTPNLSPI